MKSQQPRRRLGILSLRRSRGRRRCRRRQRGGCRGRRGRDAATAVARSWRTHLVTVAVHEASVRVVAVSEASPVAERPIRGVAKPAPGVVVSLRTLGLNDARHDSCEK